MPSVCGLPEEKTELFPVARRQSCAELRLAALAIVRDRSALLGVQLSNEQPSTRILTPLVARPPLVVCALRAALRVARTIEMMSSVSQSGRWGTSIVSAK